MERLHHNLIFCVCLSVSLFIYGQLCVREMGRRSPLGSIILAPCSLFCQFRARSSNLTIRVLSPPPRLLLKQLQRPHQTHRATLTHALTSTLIQNLTQAHTHKDYYTCILTHAVQMHTQAHKSTCMCPLIDTSTYHDANRMLITHTHVSTDTTTYLHTFPHEAHRYESTYINAHHHTHMLT